jgi:hypothetical protein
MGNVNKAGGNKDQRGVQNAHGGPDGANQGGASRGSSRMEPSHVRDASKHDGARKPSKTKK